MRSIGICSITPKMSAQTLPTTFAVSYPPPSSAEIIEWISFGLLEQMKSIKVGVVERPSKIVLNERSETILNACIKQYSAIRILSEEEWRYFGQCLGVYSADDSDYNCTISLFKNILYKGYEKTVADTEGYFFGNFKFRDGQDRPKIAFAESYYSPK